MEIKSGIGSVQISDDCVAVIAGTAAAEVEGVACLSGNFSDISEMLGKKNLAKGVSVSINDGNAILRLNIVIKNGYKLHEVSLEVQKHVKEAVENMTGLNVKEVNVNVSGLQPDNIKDKIRGEEIK